LESEGILKYVDAKYLQRELSEATGMTQDELDHAAHELLQRSTSGSSPSSHHSNGKPLYYEHLGGYGMHEMKDYNQYSRPHEQIGSTASPSAAFAGETTAEGDAAVDAVFITTI